jgi:hypothetical protein
VTNPSKKPIAPLEYLRSLPKETIQEAYHETDSGSFSKVGDAQAAAILTRHARLQGYAVEITGTTLGRYRSDIGLVSHRSPRGTLAAPAPEAEAQPSLELQEAPTVATGPDLAEAVKVMNGHLNDISRALWALVMHLKGKDDPAPKASTPEQPGGPVLVKGAAAAGGER